MKRSILIAAAVSAVIVFDSCTVTIDNTDSSGELYYRSSRADSKAETTAAETEAVTITEPEEQLPDDDGITMPEDNELAVLVGDDHEKLLAECNSLFEELGGELTVEVADSDTLYDTLAKEQISGRQIDVSTFDNGMLFPYFAVEGVAAPIDHEINMPELSDELWDVADLFAINNWHYIYPLGYEQAYRLLYDTNTLKKYGIDDPEFLPENKWTVQKLCEMAEKYHEKGGETPLAGNYGEPMHISAGKPLAVYERDPAGFFNNLFDPNMAETTDLLFQLKEKDMKMDSEFASPEEALQNDVLFYSATLFEAQKDELPDTVKTLAVPTLDKVDRNYELKVYGLALMEKSEHKAAAECYFACAAKTVGDKGSQGTYSGDYKIHDLQKSVYPYDKGISLGVSYSPAHMNEDLSLAVSPLIYTGLENKEDWGGVCAYYSKLFINDLTELNNKMRERIYGD